MQLACCNIPTKQNKPPGLIYLIFFFHATHPVTTRFDVTKNESSEFAYRNAGSRFMLRDFGHNSRRIPNLFAVESSNP